MKIENQELFFKRNVSTADVGAEIVQPPQPAAFSGTFQTCKSIDELKIQMYD